MASRSDSDSPYKQEILAAARLHIARRIARFCTTLTPAEFERLLDRMVHIHWKYDVLPHIDPLQTLDHKSTTEPTLPKQP